MNSEQQKVEKCRKCESASIVKFGRDQKGKQRYRCKGCGTTFTATSYSVVSKTHRSEDVWMQYIQFLLRGATLEECAEECGISTRTAFIWRHKILNALQKDQNTRTMTGIIEADELFVPVSYKGNHKKSKRFEMPRKALRRGTDNKKHTMPKVCVMYAKERQGQVYGEVLGEGALTVSRVEHSFKRRIAPESIVIADSAHSYKKYFNGVPEIELVQVRSNISKKAMAHKSEIKGAYHVQTVNQLHRQFRQFLDRYNGVATKYLHHYVSLFVWLENHKSLRDIELHNETESYIGGVNTYICAEDIFSRPPVPSVA